MAPILSQNSVCIEYSVEKQETQNRGQMQIMNSLVQSCLHLINPYIYYKELSEFFRLRTNLRVLIMSEFFLSPLRGDTPDDKGEKTPQKL
jgi:hypothetical protein